MTDADLDTLAATTAVRKRRRQLWAASPNTTAQYLTVQSIAEAGPQRHPLVKACRQAMEGLE